MLKIINEFNHKLSKFLEIFCILLMTIMLFIVLAQVVFRYFLLIGLPWAEELSKYLMVWMALIGSSIVLKEQEHLKVSFIVEKLKITKQIKLIYYVISLGLYYLLIVYGFEYAIFGQMFRSPSLRITRFWAYLSVPIGAIFLSIQTIIIIFNLIFLSKGGK